MEGPDSFPRATTMFAMDRPWNAAKKPDNSNSQMLLHLFRLCDDLGSRARLGPPVQTFSIPQQIVSTLSSSDIERVIEGRIRDTAASNTNYSVNVLTDAVTIIRTQSQILSETTSAINEPYPVPASTLGGTPESLQESASVREKIRTRAAAPGRKASKVRRPKNPFILFRQDHHASVAANYPSLSNCDISKIIGRMWRESGHDFQRKYQERAAEEARQHRIDHPDYQYRPRKASEKKRRVVKRKARESLQNPMAANSNTFLPITSGSGIPAIGYSIGTDDPALAVQPAARFTDGLIPSEMVKTVRMQNQPFRNAQQLRQKITQGSLVPNLHHMFPVLEAEDDETWASLMLSDNQDFPDGFDEPWDFS